MRRRCLVRLLLVLHLVLPVGAARAFTPPVDTAGALTVRIDAPDPITKLVPQKVRVTLQNKQHAPLTGTLRLGLIDGWQCSPQGEVRFDLPPTGLTLDFTVTPATDTCDNVYYPIHAWSRYSAGGVDYEAHPVALVKTHLSLPATPLPAVVDSRPLELVSPGRLGLRWDPVRRAVVQVFGRPPLVMPLGWEGVEEHSRATLNVRSVTLEGQARECIVMHPPWAPGHVGAIVAEFPLRLPDARPLRLDFARAVQPEGNGDGVTFRVRAVPLDAAQGQLGTVLYEHHSAAKHWETDSADLSSLAGRSVRLQLESHPGPKNNTSFDQSYWAEPVLTAGTPPASRPFPPAELAGSQVLGRVACGEKTYEVRVWPGSRGLLDAAVGFVAADGNPATAPAVLAFDGFDARVLGMRVSDPQSPVILKKIVALPGAEGTALRHLFSSPAGDFDLLARLWVDGDVLRAAFKLENAPPPRPWLVARLEDVSLGPWSRSAGQIYAGVGNVIRGPNKPFELGFDGHRLATSFVGLDFAGRPSVVLAADPPPLGLSVRPAQRHYTLHTSHETTLSVILCPNAWEGAKTWRRANGLQAGGGVQAAAGRFVFDLWGGRYGQSADELGRAFHYGLTDSMVIWHNWQRWGYDYRLPDLMPPSPQWGTAEEMRRLADTCRTVGVLFGPHDNYIDFYPDATGFSYPERIAYHAPGQPVRAWLNEGRQAQSYRYRADQIETFLHRNVAAANALLAPTAWFIDVWSSAPPYDYWTSDGRFFPRSYTREVWARSFDWIRGQLGGQAPQISESGHDGLIGHLDGGQTNHLRVGRPVEGSRNWTVWDIPCDDTERIPWYDTAHHDRFILHGAGYPGRYEGGLNPRDHGIYSDDYIATEVLTGHPAMVSQAFGPQVVRKYWLLHDLGRALALRTIQHVEFDAGDLHRQHVTWSGQGQVWVNRGESDWTLAAGTAGQAAGEVLPQYGFLARVPTPDGVVQAGIVRREGQIVEWSRSPQATYVNGRLPLLDVRRISVKVEKIEPLGNRQFQVRLAWQADDPIPAGMAPFFHFVDAKGEIVFMAQSHPGRFDTAQRGALAGTARFSVPQNIPAGCSFGLHFGIYQPGHGRRLALTGPDDGTQRIRLGRVQLEGRGDRLTGLAWQPETAAADPALARFNTTGRPVAFATIITAGGCQLHRDGDRLTIIPLPPRQRDDTPAPKFTAQVQLAAFPGLPAPTHIELLSETGQVLSTAPAHPVQNRVAIECPPEAWACRLAP